MDATFKDFVLDQLHILPGVQARSMFGGFGLYQEDCFFGIIHGGRVYLKTDATDRKRFTALGMGPFQPNRRQRLKSYYEVPLDILEDAEMLARWAERAIGISARTHRRPD